MRRTSSWRSICLYPSENGRCTIIVKKFRSQNAQIFGYVYQNTNGQKHGLVWKIQSFLSNEICMVHPVAGLLWERQFEKVLLKNTVAKKFQIGNVCSLTEKKDYSYLCMWTISNWLGRNKTLTQCGKYLWKTLIWADRHHSLTICWCCTQRECKTSKDIVDNYRTMFESRISAGENRKASILWETWRKHFLMFPWYGRSCKETCRTILRTGE